jgi:hypothetical protein
MGQQLDAALVFETLTRCATLEAQSGRTAFERTTRLMGASGSSLDAVTRDNVRLILATEAASYELGDPTSELTALALHGSTADTSIRAAALMWATHRDARWINVAVAAYERTLHPSPAIIDLMRSLWLQRESIEVEGYVTRIAAVVNGAAAPDARLRELINSTVPDLLRKLDSGSAHRLSSNAFEILAGAALRRSAGLVRSIQCTNQACIDMRNSEARWLDQKGGVLCVYSGDRHIRATRISAIDCDLPPDALHGFDSDFPTFTFEPVRL